MVFLTFIKGLHECFDDLRFSSATHTPKIHAEFIRICYSGMISYDPKCPLLFAVQKEVCYCMVYDIIVMCTDSSEHIVNILFTNNFNHVRFEYAIVTLVASTGASGHMADSLLKYLLFLCKHSSSPQFPRLFDFWFYRLEGA